MNLKNLFKWLCVSNRPKHLLAGFILASIILSMLLVLTYLGINDLAKDIITTNVCVLIAMMSVEYIQRRMDAKWDWLDILAGMLTLLVLDIIVLIV